MLLQAASSLSYKQERGQGHSSSECSSVPAKINGVQRQSSGPAHTYNAKKLNSRSQDPVSTLAVNDAACCLICLHKQDAARESTHAAKLVTSGIVLAMCGPASQSLISVTPATCMIMCVIVPNQNYSHGANNISSVRHHTTRMHAIQTRSKRTNFKSQGRPEKLITINMPYAKFLNREQ